MASLFINSLYGLRCSNANGLVSDRPCCSILLKDPPLRLSDGLVGRKERKEVIFAFFAFLEL